MIVGICGIACEICPLRVKGKCEIDGCVPGTDEKAPEKLEKLKAAGKTCEIMECAIQKKVDYCLSCEEFPCEIHYRQSPYCEVLFDYFNDFSKYKGKFKCEEKSA